MSHKKSPRVLFLISKIGPGGAQRIVIDLANAVVSIGGYACILVNYKHPQDKAFYERIDSRVTIETFSGEVPQLQTDKFLATRKILILIAALLHAANWIFSGKLQNFDLVHSHLFVGSVISWWMRVCSKFTGRPKPVFIETFHSDFATTRRWERTVFLLLWRTLDLLVLEYRRRDVKLISDRINTLLEYIRFGVEPFVQPELSKVREFKEEFGLFQNIPVILTIARINFNDKRIDKLLEAISHLSSKYEEKFVYLLCGDGKDYNRVLKLAEDLGMQKQVKLTGYIDDPSIPISVAKIFIVSGVEDLVGIAGLNAASRGIPVLTYQKDPDWNQQGDFFFNSRSTIEIASELSRLLEDKHYYETESIRNKQLMREHFNLQSMVCSYMDLYTDQVSLNQK